LGPSYISSFSPKALLLLDYWEYWGILWALRGSFLGTGALPFFDETRAQKQNKKTGRPDRATMNGLSNDDSRDEDEFLFLFLLLWVSFLCSSSLLLKGVLQSHK
jgi:hypothetical protein